jgi:hypothetical protein
MKTVTVLGAVILVSAAIGFARRTAPSAPPSTLSAPLPAGEPHAPLGDSGATISGEIREVIDVAEYTYVRLATPGADTWAAVRKQPLNVGQAVSIVGAMRMEGFKSSTLGRTFEVIYFGELAGSGSSAAREGAPLPPGHPPLGADAMTPPDHGRATPATGPQPPIERATGENARSVAELYADRTTLAGKRLRVRGRVVKATPGVLGKNYYRLRDGSSTEPGKTDLVLTTQATLTVGDVVTLEGTLRTDVDVGIGVLYPVLLEDATLPPGAP